MEMVEGRGQAEVGKTRLERGRARLGSGPGRTTRRRHRAAGVARGEMGREHGKGVSRQSVTDERFRFALKDQGPPAATWVS
jgi:hypothetical protein